MLYLSLELAKTDKKNIYPLMFQSNYAFLAKSGAHPLLQLAASWCVVRSYTHIKRAVEVYWSCRSVKLQSAMMGRGDKSGYLKSVLAGSRRERGTKHRIRRSPVRLHFPSKCQTEQCLKIKSWLRQCGCELPILFSCIYESISKWFRQ